MPLTPTVLERTRRKGNGRRPSEPKAQASPTPTPSSYCSFFVAA
jgi:hypothetical protein